MSCKLQTENVSNILCDYLCASHNQLFLRRFCKFSVASKCAHLLQRLQSTDLLFWLLLTTFAFFYFVASHQTRWYNKRMLTKGYSVPRDFSWIENYKLIWLALITCWCYFTTHGILEQTWNCGSVSPNNWFSKCREDATTTFIIFWDFLMLGS